MHNARPAPRHRKEATTRKYAVNTARAAATLGTATLLTISGMTLAQAATESALNSTAASQQPGAASFVVAAATDLQTVLDIDPIVPPVDPPVVPPVDPPVDPPVVPPVDPPVVPPVDPPVDPPVGPPVDPPVDPPVGPPVDPPVGPPVDPPVGPPVDPPVDPPVGPPVDPPVDPPVGPPVDPPVEVPGNPSVGSPVAPQPGPPAGSGVIGTVTPHQALPGTVAPLAATGQAAAATTVADVPAEAGQPAKRITVPAGEAVQLQPEGSQALQIGGGLLVAGAAGAMALRLRPRRNNG